MKQILSGLLLSAMITGLAGCAGGGKKSDGEVVESSLDSAASKLTLVQLEEAALAFRVAFDRSLDSWQTTGEQAISGCHIKGDVAERGLRALRPWIDRRASEEAKKLLAGPQTYRLPINDQNCANDCTCGVALRVLEAAKIDEQTSSRFKEWKRLRAQLEAKAELQTSDRSEICAEGLTWVCKSELLSALKAQE